MVSTHPDRVEDPTGDAVQFLTMALACSLIRFGAFTAAIPPVAVRSSLCNKRT